MMAGYGDRKRLVAGLLLIVMLFPIIRPRALEADFSVDFATVISSGPSHWGTNTWWTDQDAGLWTTRWRELGLTLARVPVSHALLEPENDNADPAITDPTGFLLNTPISMPLGITRTLTYRTWFEALRAQPEVDVMIMLAYLAPWLSDNPPHSGYVFPVAPYPPNDLAEYQEFVEALLRYLVEDLGFPPERLLVEAMNEPDLGCGQDPAVPCFWQNWTMQDVADVVRVTHDAIAEVAPEIRLVGLAECCGTSVVRQLLDGYPEGSYLEGLSYHYYAPSGYSITEALNRGTLLGGYGLPLFLDEYGSLEYHSEGINGGLWHSWVLPDIWKAGIAPAQYPISEHPLHPEPYNSMGLFRDWTYAIPWERKPAYWAYADFYHLAAGSVISSTAPANNGLKALATRRFIGGAAQATVWVVNRQDTPMTDQTFAIYNFPGSAAALHVYDGLITNTAILTASLSGAPLIFTATLPARSVRAFVISSTEQLNIRLYLPLVLRDTVS